MATKATPKRTTGAAVAQQPQVFYRINSLLYTLRAISQHEDQLCMLMHHIRTTGRLSPALAEELREILEDIPGMDYLHDLEAVRSALDAAAPETARTRSSRTISRAVGRRKVA